MRERIDFVPQEVPMVGLGHMVRHPSQDERNRAILERRMGVRRGLAQPQVGEWLKLPDGSLSRITVILGQGWLQVGGQRWGRAYLGEGGYGSYSGGCGDVHPVAGLVHEGETAPGNVWFFDLDMAGPQREVMYEVAERVWRYSS